MISKRSALQPVGGASLVQDPHYQVAFDNSAHMEYQTRNIFLRSDYVAVIRISMMTMMIDYSNDDDDDDDAKDNNDDDSDDGDDDDDKQVPKQLSSHQGSLSGDATWAPQSQSQWVVIVIIVVIIVNIIVIIIIIVVIIVIVII